MTDKRYNFEQDLQALARAEVGFAAGQDEEPHRLLREALSRLEANPALFSGDADGVFTYEDPVLAAASLWHRKGTEAAANVGVAAGEGVSKWSIFNWMLTGISAWLNRPKGDYISLAGKTPQASVRLDKPLTRVAIIGDAGYNGSAQATVFRYVRERHRENPFDLVIHLGDTYFGGGEAEMLSNLLAPLSTLREGNVFTLCGNHDLYYGAKGYLAALHVLHQPGRYFAIETPRWRIACLDTALGAEGFLRDDGALDEGQLEWLDGCIAADDGRRLVLMSHHFIVSAWGGPSPTLNEQLAARLRDGRRIFSWYWGHEHGCATYGREPHGFYGACVGNGAFLQEYEEPVRPETTEWYAKGRCGCPGSAASKYWPHGYLELELGEEGAIETYHLENGETYARTLRGPEPEPRADAQLDGAPR
ncbi:MAG: hypothetical protein QOE46_803 [Acidobacteriota bacterium]|jgi:hypothetical protein|nr:hypothetical protein [Acidobacteriota bacterium]